MVDVQEDENIRISLNVVDFVASYVGDSTLAQTGLKFTLEYTNGDLVESNAFNCSLECVDGTYNGDIDLKNERNDTVKVSDVELELQDRIV